MPSMSFSSVTTDDGNVQKTDSSYPPGGTATVNTTNASVTVGRRFTGGNYAIFTGLILFDTSGLPDDATILGVDLNLYGKTNNDNDNRSMVVEWYDASNWPISSGDYAESSTGDAGTFDLGGISGGANTFPLTNFAGAIDVAGDTGIRLHIDGGQPTADNILAFAADEDASNPAPQLTVYYSTPSDPWVSDGTVPGGRQIAVANRWHNAQADAHVSSTDDGATWSTPVDPGETQFDTLYGGMAASGDNVYLLSAEGDMGGGEQVLNLLRSEDNGATWDAPVEITDTGKLAHRAYVVAEGDNVYVVWHDFIDSGSQNVYLRRSNDAGDNWESIQTIVNADGGGGAGVGVDPSTGTVMICYTVDQSGVGKAAVVRSTNDGSSFGTEDVIGGSTEGGDTLQARPRIVGDDGQWVCMWEGNLVGSGASATKSVDCVLSDDDGATWGSIVTAFPGAVTQYGHHIIAKVGSVVYTAVAGDRIEDVPYDLDFRYSYNHGATWSSTETIDDAQDDVTWWLAADDSVVMVTNLESELYRRAAVDQPALVPLLDASPTLPNPTVTAQPVTISPPVLDASPSLPNPSVTVGDATISPPVLDASPALPNPSVSTTVTVTAPTLDASPTLPNPSVTTETTISPPLLDASPSLPNPSVTTGPVTVSPPLLDASPTLPNPTVTEGTPPATVIDVRFSDDGTAAQFVPSGTTAEFVASGTTAEFQ